VHVLAAGSISDRLPGMKAEKGMLDLMRCIRKSFFNLTMEGFKGGVLWPSKSLKSGLPKQSKIWTTRF
jgi:hypothetical protein